MRSKHHSRDHLGLLGIDLAAGCGCCRLSLHLSWRLLDYQSAKSTLVTPSHGTDLPGVSMKDSLMY